MLIELLRSIRSARDTSSLFEELGYVNDHPTAGDDGWVVARWRGFEIVARDAEDPRKDARSLASRLGGASRRALALAVGTDEPALAAPPPGVGGRPRGIAGSPAHPGPP